jgi:predicted ATP-grasp superfamily ATP-dependent carboligase
MDVKDIFEYVIFTEISKYKIIVRGASMFYNAL